MENDDPIITRLRSLPPVQVSRDLAPSILSRVREESARPPRKPVWRFIYPLAAAATVALLLGGLRLTLQGPRDPGRQAVEWLCQTQEADGSWSTVRWGGDRHFEVALTALSLMTLLGESTPGQVPPDIAGPANAAIAYLLRSQRENGSFGEAFSGSPYNQGIATLALARAYQVRKDGALRLALERAVGAIRGSQYADGGWGYEREARPASNLSITLWQIEALRLAALVGVDGLRPNIERGLRWMSGVASDDGSFGYQRRGDTAGAASQTLTAMGAMSLLDTAHANLMPAGRRQAIKAQMARLAASPGPDLDYYHRYFLTAALKQMDGDTARRDLTTLRHDLLSRQVKRGTEAGSWRPDDRWASSGGRIYATAMASLSLL